MLSVVLATGLIYWFRSSPSISSDEEDDEPSSSSSSSLTSTKKTKTTLNKNSKSTMSSKPAALHYAWNESTKARSAELAAAGVDTSPKPISAHSPIAETNSVPKGGSAWNSAGTYEEKDATTRSLSLLREHLLKASCLLCNGAYAFRIVKVGKADGHVLRVFARGKARLGFELTVSVDFEVLDAAQAGGGEGGVRSKGSIHLEEIADTNSDVFEKLVVSESSSTSATSQSVLKTALKGREMEEFFRREIKTWVISALE